MKLIFTSNAMSVPDIGIIIHINTKVCNFLSKQ